MGLRLWVFGALLLAASAASLSREYLPAFCTLFAIGLVAWTLLEYLIHRLAFHGFAPHWQHHASPTDSEYTLAPVSLSGSATAALFVVMRLVAGSWMASASITAGVMAGYLAYEAVHLRIHSPARGGKLLRALRKHHFYHHFASDRVCYGVTSPVWDVVFRSLPGKSATASARPARRPDRPGKTRQTASSRP
jgi:sterol desaturase/sphingolipid hydroxylase (fatty acid hydroxylase superfamily)